MAKAALCLIVVGAFGLGARVLAHAGEEVYAVPDWGVAVTVALVAACVAGSLLVLRSGRAGFGLLSLAAAAFTVLGVLAIASIGLLVLPLGIGLMVWAARMTGPPAAAIGGAAAGVALPVLLAFALAGPVVDCGDDGTGSGENVFLLIAGIGGDGVSEGGAMDGGEGPERGHASGPGYRYTYTCENGRLTQFDLRWR